MNIIIIDDEPKIRKGMTHLLSQHEGWNVIGTFADAQRALSYLYEHEVDVVITDIQMPGMQGLDMIQRIRKVNREIPVIIISGYSRFDYAQRAIELGVRKYLTKPTSPSEISQVLEQIESELAQRVQSMQTQFEHGRDGPEITNLLILRAIEHIEKNYVNKLTLKDVAGALYISPNYLSELFKKITGSNFTDYLLDLRMEKSRIYLADVTYKIKDVSVLVGFSDARYFSNTFRKKFGMTPLDYRNKYAARQKKTE
jgi:YesN/AraC family two-component response regulator